ncbi:MAG: hypothetical protein R3B13_02730 [Polyangiaceae bacterium]
MSALVASLDRLALPADRLRRSLYALVARVPGAAPWLVRRDRRVALIASAHAGIAFLITATFPMLLFVLGPVLLGVAHVASDVRYLVLRRRVPAWWKLATLSVCVALIGLRAAGEMFHGIMLLYAEHAIALVWMSFAGLAALRLGGSGRRAAIMGLVLMGLGAASILAPLGSRVAFVHLHNCVAVGLWLWLFRMRLRYAAIPLLCFAVALWMLNSNWVLTLLERTGGSSAFGLHLLAAADFTAPGVSSRFALTLTLSFVFLQSVHYAAWLLLIPQEDMTRQAPITFRRSARSLVEDFGAWGVSLILLAAAAVIAGAFSDVLASRRLYLSLAMFHNYLELAAATFFFVLGAPSKAQAGGAEAVVTVPG